jgi:TP901 family phage tail tape measure protein
MALTIADIQVILSANITAFQNNMNNATSTVQRLQGFMTSAGRNLTLGLTLPILAMGKASVDAAAEFDQSMANIRAITGATGDQMKSLSKLALEMGASTTFSASEASDGMLELLKAGLSVEEVMGGGLKGALDLAAAGGIELSEAAIVASTALNAFRKDGLSVSDAADILAGSANASAASVSSLQLGLSQVSAVASGVGFSFADTSAALALFANNGLKGSDAGTSLKTMFLNLQPRTKEQIALFKELGLTTAKGTSAFFDQEGKVKSLAEISGLLKSSLSGMTDAQRLATLETLFGSDAIRAANILYKEGAEGVNKLKEQIGNVSAEQVAKERMDSFRGSIEELKGSLETAGIIIGQKLIPILEGLGKAVKGVTDWFIKLDPNIQNGILVFLGLTAAIGPLLLLFAGVSAAIGILTPVAALLGVTVGGLTLGFLAVPAAIAAVIAIAGMLGISFEDVKKKTTEVTSKITKDWEDMKKSLESILGGADEDMNTFNNNSFASWDAWLKNIKDKTSQDFKDVQTSISDALTASDKVILDNTNSFRKSFENWLISIDTKISEIMPKIGKFIEDSLIASDKVILEKTTSWGTTFENWLRKTDEDFAKTMPDVGSSIESFLNTSDEDMANWAFMAGETVGKVVKYFIDLPDKIDIALQKTWQTISDKWRDVRTNTVAWWDIIVSQIVNYIESLPGRITGGLQKTWQTISDKWRDVRTNTVAWWDIIVGQVVNYIESIPGRIVGGLQSIWQTISNKWRDVSNNTVAWFGIIVSNVGRAISQIPGQISTWLSGLLPNFRVEFQRVIDYVNGLPGILYTKARNIASNFWEGFKSGLRGSPKTKMEYEFINMGNQAFATLQDIKSLTPGYAATGRKIMDAFQPQTGLMAAGTPGGLGMGVTSPMTATTMAVPTTTTAPTSYSEGGGQGNWGGVQVSVAQLVVREEADVLKVAQQLYRLQKDRTRGRGTR